MKTLILLLALFSFNAFADKNVDLFVQNMGEEYNLSNSDLRTITNELHKSEEPYIKARKLFCVEGGVGIILDLGSFTCRNLKGEKIYLSITGLGFSIGLHSGVGILYAKKNSRNFKEGTYNVVVKGIHFGLGVESVKITNDNESINWIFRGVTIGAGINASAGRLTMEKAAN